MPELHQLLLFVAAGLLLNLTPGPDVLYIVSHALRSGTRAGIVAGLGITAGCFVHIVAAALGVSALMAASSTAFGLLKWLGAAYLLWIGLRMLFSRGGQNTPNLIAGGAAGTGAIGIKALFFGGFWTNALNPKVALFFLAFVPQFIAPDAQHKPLAFFLLGLLFNFNGIFINVAWAVLAGWMARRLGVVQRGMQALQRVAGLMFIGFGLKLALTDHPAT
ncbi:Threonine/homoserine/homoserine lactone efflux protein [Polaromonas sp. OV174]|uniref:LysE family translocator n=1 Tax=Polaromonas sp. OV174 TaxID=1855300 RepID=UPI0008F42685|nr:LysE family translocator [Polaromonas sp. OV174]SFC79222.1 Threonine/homoserine/homoserine lactone efflux protein [Polaromonas sp. OV174]